MRRTQLMLPDDLRARADARATREGRSFASVVREALERFLADDEQADIEAAAQALEDLIAWVEANPGRPHGPIDSALNHDHYLYGAPKEHG